MASRPSSPRRSAAAWNRLSESQRWRYRKAFGSEAEGRAAWLRGEPLSKTQRGHTAAPRPATPNTIFQLSPQKERARERANEALGYVRNRGWSLDRAAKRAGTTPDAVLRHAGSAFEQGPGGRWKAKATDDLPRIMPIISGGVLYTEVAVAGSEAASIISAHLRAIDRYLQHGRDDDLRSFAGVVVDGVLPDGTAVAFELESDPDTLLDLERLGVLDDLVVPS